MRQQKLKWDEKINSKLELRSVQYATPPLPRGGGRRPEGFYHYDSSWNRFTKFNFKFWETVTHFRMIIKYLQANHPGLRPSLLKKESSCFLQNI